MFSKIVVVCFANVCRSPAAELILSNKLQGLDVQVRSAGIQAQPGMRASQTMSTLVLEQGIDLSDHRSTLLDQAGVTWSDLILVMAAEHKRFIEAQFPQACGRVKLLGHWDDAEIFDPYRKEKEKYIHALAQINASIESWCQKVWSTVA